jgi:hypothetical protein
MKTYIYDRHSQKWRDMQTSRWISRKTLISRTGVAVDVVADFENGRDGHGHKMSRDERRAKMPSGVAFC